VWTRLGIVSTTTDSADPLLVHVHSLPNVTVTSLHYDRFDNVLIAGTLGRGTWRMSNALTDLTQMGVLQITGDHLAPGTNDLIKLQRNAANPLLLNVEVDEAGVPIDKMDVPFSLLQSISVDGGTGADTLSIDLTNGSFSIPGGIQFNGSDNTDTLQLTPGLDHYQASQTGPSPDANGVTRGSVSIVSGDNNNPRLTIAFTGVVQIQPNGIPLLLTPNAPGGDLLATLADGLQQTADRSAAFLDSGTLRVPGISSLAQALRGDPPPPGQVSDNSTDPEQAAPTSQDTSEGSDILRRLIETGLGAFQISDIGLTSANQTITQRLDELEQQFVGLDPNGSVSMTQANGTTQFDVKITKTLEGTADFDATALNGLVGLSGTVDLTANVTLHLIFGVDSQGFYIAEDNPDPEFVIDHITGTVQGTGQLGILEVTLSDGNLKFDPNVRIEINLHDPGTDGQDGLIRPSELGADLSSLVSVTVVSAGNNADVSLSGTFQVSALNFPLANLGLTLSWANVTDFSSASLTVTPPSTGTTGTTGDGASFLQIVTNTADTLNDVLNGIRSVAQAIQQVTGTQILSTKIPILNKSLGDLLNGPASPIVVADTAVASISATEAVSNANEFQVFVTGLNLLQSGVEANNTVTYKGTDGNDHTGTIAQVDANQFTVSFDSGLTQDPDPVHPNFRITPAPQGALQTQLESILAGLTDSKGVTIHIPTLQELLRQLARSTGIDLLNKVSVTGSGTNLTLNIPLAYTPPPIKFSLPVDFSDSIGALKLSGGTQIDLSFRPQIQITLGVNLAPGVPLAQRFFIETTTQFISPSSPATALPPELTLTAQATFHNPDIRGSIGFFNVALKNAPDPAGVTPPTDGLNLTATVAETLNDPGTPSATEPDGRITLDELAPDKLGGIFQVPTLSGSLVLHPLVITASLGTQTSQDPLGSITIRSHRTTDSRNFHSLTSSLGV
jgi:hypothetical protein